MPNFMKEKIDHTMPMTPDEDIVLEAIDTYYNKLDGRTREEITRSTSKIEERLKEVKAELLS